MLVCCPKCSFPSLPHFKEYELMSPCHLFQEILVVRIAAGSKSDGAVGPELTVVGVDEDRYETVSLGEAVDVSGDPGHRVLVPGVPRHSAEVSELQLDRGNFGCRAVRAPLGGVTRLRPQVNIRIWNS